MNRSTFRSLAVVLAVLATWSQTLRADSNSSGPNGIDALATGLTGNGVSIGQLEGGRPPLNPPDNNANINPLVTPSGLFIATSPLPANGAFPNFNQSAHATGVAGTMISTGVSSWGISTGAQLFSGDIFNNSTQTINAAPGAAGDYRNAMLTGQRVASTAGMRAINMSFGYFYGAPNINNLANLDGTNQFTQFVDWSATRHDMLYVTAGNETGGSLGADIPTDSYNGIVVGALTTDVNGRYTTMANFNVVSRLPTDGRRTIDIVAPGDKLTLATLGANAIANNQAGTSFAAPHVTATAALLNEEATLKNLGANSHHHEVTKAVILNSADKVQGVLGMQKTITRGTTRNNDDTGNDPNSNGNNWVQQRALEVGNAVNRDATPLDAQLGTGALNASRAKTQLDAGEQGPGAVQFIGWDYNGTSDASQIRYELPTMSDGDWISALLTWDRSITLNETLMSGGNPLGVDGNFSAETYIDLTGGTANVFDAGEPLNDLNANNTFDNLRETLSVNGLSDLDLYLMPRGESNLANYTARSISSIDSLEHIFFQVPNGGDYDIMVRANNLPVGAQSYGLAWWAAVPEPATVVLMAVALLAFVAFGWRQHRQRILATC